MNLSRYYIIVFTFPVLLIGSQFAQLGDSITVSLDSSAQYLYKSNVYKSPTQISDDIYIVSPGFKVDFGTPYTNLDLSLKLSYDILKYASLDQLDSEHLSSYFSGQYKGAASHIVLSYNYIEGQTAQSSLMNAIVTDVDETLIETESNYVNLSATYQYSPKLSLSTGLKLNKLDYATYEKQYASKENLTIPLNLNYKYSDKLGIIYGVEFTEREVGERYTRNNLGQLTLSSLSYESDDIFYKIGFSGQLMPKLTGIFNVGFRTVEFSDNRENDNEDSWAIDSKLVWSMTPKFKTNLGMRRFMDSAGSGDSYTLTRFYFGNNYDINSEFSLTLSGDFAFKEYVSNSDRTDETNTYELIVNYLPSSDLFFSAGYSYTDNRSHFIQYNAREFLLSANFKY